jgi:hypothetical protein
MPANSYIKTLVNRNIFQKKNYHASFLAGGRSGGENITEIKENIKTDGSQEWWCTSREAEVGGAQVQGQPKESGKVRWALFQKQNTYKGTGDMACAKHRVQFPVPETNNKE